MAEDITDLVARAVSREATAFETLIERYERSALAVAYAILQNADQSGDAVQDAFLRAWQELPRLKDAARFGGWLMQIVRYAAIDLRRRNRPTVEYPEWEAADASNDPAAMVEKEDRAARVKRALSLLEETTRSAVLLKYFQGLSTKEIAEALAMSPAAVDMRISRGRNELRVLLADLVDAEFPRVVGE